MPVTSGGIRTANVAQRTLMQIPMLPRLSMMLSPTSMPAIAQHSTALSTIILLLPTVSSRRRTAQRRPLGQLHGRRLM